MLQNANAWNHQGVTGWKHGVAVSLAGFFLRVGGPSVAASFPTCRVNRQVGKLATTIGVVEGDRMTQEEWLACNIPLPMLWFLQGRASDRKDLLFNVACCR